jgi:putative flavoprotein involved in K+ transport
VPFDVNGLPARLGLTRLVLRVLFHRIFSMATPIGRRIRPAMLHRAAPLIRTKSRHLEAAGIVRVPRLAGVRDGRPLLADGRVLDVENVVWCTGFDAGFSWIDLPVFDASGEARHEAGVVASEPGLFFVGLHFLYAFSSDMIHGVGRDAARIAGLVARRAVPAEQRHAPSVLDRATA